MPSVRDIVTGVLQGSRAEIETALRRAAGNPRTVLAFMEMAAKLGRELGPGAEGGGTGIVIRFVSNINPMALRAASGRALPLEPTDA